MNNKVSGKNFVLTGLMENKREDLVEMIKNSGGNVKGAVTKNFDYLVVADFSTVKARKAIELGVELINEAQLLEMVRV